ncbi:hypothetical protein P4S72_16885 [Vibrio sp. PP-XX7]
MDSSGFFDPLNTGRIKYPLLNIVITTDRGDDTILDDVDNDVTFYPVQLTKFME